MPCWGYDGDAVCAYGEAAAAPGVPGAGAGESCCCRWAREVARWPRGSARRRASSRTLRICVQGRRALRVVSSRYMNGFFWCFAFRPLARFLGLELVLVADAGCRRPGAGVREACGVSTPRDSLEQTAVGNEPIHRLVCRAVARGGSMASTHLHNTSHPCSTRACKCRNVVVLAPSFVHNPLVVRNPHAPPPAVCWPWAAAP